MCKPKNSKIYKKMSDLHLNISEHFWKIRHQTWELIDFQLFQILEPTNPEYRTVIINTLDLKQGTSTIKNKQGTNTI